MARFSSPARLRALGVGREARVFNVLNDFDTNRFEELNNYSGRMTRQIVVISAGLAEDRFDPLQNRLVPDLVTGRVEMDTIEGVMLRHSRQRNE